MILTDVNFIAVIVAAALNLALGYGWYHPQVFGKLWSACRHEKGGTCEAGPMQYIGAFAVGLVFSWIFGALLNYFGITTVADSFWFGFWIWLGFVAAPFFSGVIWAGVPLTAYFINAGYYLAYFLVVSIVFGIVT